MNVNKRHATFTWCFLARILKAYIQLEKAISYQNVQVLKPIQPITVQYFCFLNLFSFYCKIFPIHSHGETFNFCSATASTYVQQVVLLLLYQFLLLQLQLLVLLLLLLPHKGFFFSCVVQCIISWCIPDNYFLVC